MNRDEILLGNGSDEIVQALIIALCEPGEKILVPTPTFVMYQAIGNFLGIDTVASPLNDDWSLDIEKTLELIREHNPKVVFLASPNNPTGTLYSAEDIKSVIDTAKGVVVVDEAYYRFCG